MEQRLLKCKMCQKELSSFDFDENYCNECFEKNEIENKNSEEFIIYPNYNKREIIKEDLKKENEINKDEDFAIILDYFPKGYQNKYPVAYNNKFKMEYKNKIEIVHCVSEKDYSILEAVPKKGVMIDLNERVYIGSGKRDKIHHVIGILENKNLREKAKVILLNVFKIKGIKNILERKYGFNNIESISGDLDKKNITVWVYKSRIPVRSKAEKDFVTLGIKLNIKSKLGSYYSEKIRKGKYIQI